MSLRTSAHAGVAIRSPKAPLADQGEHPVKGRKAPLADQGWCSAQRIRILMIASGNHTIIHAVMAVSRKAMTEGIRTLLFPGTPCERNLTIPQSKIRDFCQQNIVV